MVGKGEINNLSYIPILELELIQRPKVQGPHRAGFDTDWLMALGHPLDTKIAFLHLGTFLNAKLGDIIGTSISAEHATILGP